ncbi:acetyl-CoA synthetase [Amycolatopsis xylanica]|uniref:Acetyl-CoA synthetase n=1 Tax=Amycolatopsis xylanica TaxID=589385 RepID=A0A1H2TKH6_9PSEU|nr:acetate--CoA ligase family protein [Amycolatopsis xylanica]SDW44401.1 acetyl-CoA synthetase [Amycolatopsis xylanica]
MGGVTRRNLRRLLAPRHIAVAGGAAAVEVIRQSKQIGFAGEIWPVHPERDEIAGVPCFPDVWALPEAPDATFVSVRARSTVDFVATLSQVDAGGVVCHASGFAETGARGSALQAELVEAAGDLAVIGPNCFGLLNYVDGVALWPDQHGGHRVERGVAILSQSGNVAHSLTMQRRSLPIAHVVTVGNSACTRIPELIDAMVDDDRVTAIGLYLEAIDDVQALARAATRSLRRGVPVVALKSGSSELGARTNLSHTSALSTSDDLCTALFERCGIARVHDLAGLAETLKFLHVHGPLPGGTIASASCSGGEAALVADLASARGLEMPDFPVAAREKLTVALGEKVGVANPLDYQTYIWGDAGRQLDCFSGLLSAGFDQHLLVLDYPRLDRCHGEDWHSTVDSFIAARAATGAPASVVSMLPEGIPEEVGAKLLEARIAPMQGMAECLDAIRAAREIGQVREQEPPFAGSEASGPVRQLDEWESKRALAEVGVPVPHGVVVDADEAPDAACELGFPVVLKAVSETLAHKTEAGAVKLDLRDAESVRIGAKYLRRLSSRLLVEQMATGVLAELIVGVRADPRFGLALTIGSGGTLVELIGDSVTLLLPARREDISAAVKKLRVYRLLTGFRSKPPADLAAVLDAVEAIAAYATSIKDTLAELDVNPLLVFARGVLAVDAVIRLRPDTGTALTP